MTNSKNLIGEISSLWRFPVKSMGGERLREIEITPNGVLGDRAYALLDIDTGKVVSAKSVKFFPDLIKCHAEFVTPPLLDEKIPAVQITLPNETVLRSDDPDVHKQLSNYFGRSIKLIEEAPEDFTIDQYHPDIAEVDPSGKRHTTVNQKLGHALFKSAGLTSPVPMGSFLDVFPVSIITSSTLTKLNFLSPNSHFDERRFRMNIVVKTVEEGFLENSWVGKTIQFGAGPQLSVAMPDPRCVMTTLEQTDLAQDLDILRTLVKHNRLELPGMGSFPCAGVYAVVHRHGKVKLTDSVLI